MAINAQHVTGFVIGLGAAAAGFYFYKKNQKKVDAWLRQQGINLPVTGGSDYGPMTLEELIREKESLEDLIAEREYEAEQQEPAPAKAPKRKAKKARRKRKGK
jgi:hypothetical protein